MDEKPVPGIFRKFAWLIISGLIFFVFLAVILGFAYGTYLLFFTPEGQTIVSIIPSGFLFYVFYYLGFIIFDIGWLLQAGSISIGLIFILCCIVYLISLVLLFLRPSTNFFSKLISLLKRETLDPFEENGLLSIIIFLGVNYIIIYVLVIIVTFIGLPLGGPTEINLLFIIEGVLAAVLEEFWFRLVLIGPFLGIGYCWFIRKHSVPEPYLKIFLAALINPSHARERSGNYGGLYRFEYFLIIASAAYFGILHVIGMWEIGFLPVATVGGLFLAYSYVRFGLKGSLFFHWTFNFIQSIAAVTIQEDIVIAFGILLIYPAWLILGLVGIILGLIHARRR
ncbi:MAG: hypothetical protein ACFFCD_10790 [Promethearchaeota archaeon]